MCSEKASKAALILRGSTCFSPHMIRILSVLRAIFVMISLLSTRVISFGCCRGVNRGCTAQIASGPQLASLLARSYSKSRLSFATSPENSGESEAKWSVRCSSAEDIECLGRDMSALLHPGDVVLLKGDLGAGKTTLARGLIRNKFKDSEMVVTSPSYLLDNVYEYAEGEKIHHMDLYRLPNGCDMSVLGMPGIFDDCLCLIEWPQRLSDHFFPQDFLAVDLSIAEDESRVINFYPSSSVKWDKLEVLF